jgi:hypothetical protein
MNAYVSPSVSRSCTAVQSVFEPEPTPRYIFEPSGAKTTVRVQWSGPNMGMGTTSQRDWLADEAVDRFLAGLAAGAVCAIAEQNLLAEGGGSLTCQAAAPMRRLNSITFTK